MLRAISFALMGLMLTAHLCPLSAERLRESTDFLEVNASEDRSTGSLTPNDFKRDSERRGRRQRRSVEREEAAPVKMRDGSVFDVGKVKNYKVLRDDQVVELRNPRSGRLEMSIIKAAALPEEDLTRQELRYTVMELDELSVTVAKHDDKPRIDTVDLQGNFNYPLLGKIKVKGLTEHQIAAEVTKAMRDYVREPEVTVKVTNKGHFSNIIIFDGKGLGRVPFEGHERILDRVVYSDKVEDFYDKYCVLRKRPDGSMMCIVVDVEYMYKSFDFKQNIPLKAGDILITKKMPPLMGKHVSFWLIQVQDWIDQILDPIEKVIDIDREVQNLRDTRLLRD